MKRWLAAFAIFTGGLLALLLATTYRAYHHFSNMHAQGATFVRVSWHATLIAAIVLAVFAIWSSKKLVR